MKVQGQRRCARRRPPVVFCKAQRRPHEGGAAATARSNWINVIFAVTCRRGVCLQAAVCKYGLLLFIRLCSNRQLRQGCRARCFVTISQHRSQRWAVATFNASPVDGVHDVPSPTERSKGLRYPCQGPLCCNSRPCSALLDHTLRMMKKKLHTEKPSLPWPCPVHNHNHVCLLYELALRAQCSPTGLQRF
jgi:hypothetical protein